MQLGHKKKSSFLLALAALGIVFGDIGTSPMYAVSESMRASGSPHSPASVLGVTSLIFWTLALIVSVKYLLFITRVDNDGEGGIFAIVSVIKSKVGSNDSVVMWIMTAIAIASTGLLFADSLITPALSVMAATEGAKMIYDGADQWVVSASIVILTTLFAVQRYGTDALSRFFSPVMIVWFIAIALTGFKAIITKPIILDAVMPQYGYDLLLSLSWSGRFNLLGSILLAATGAEAIYADMGHFGRRPISIAWYGFALVSLLLSYFGQGAWLLTHHAGAGSDDNPFFAIIPLQFMAPMVVLATLASVIASQAVISGMFSLANQAIRLNYLPRLEIRHTSLTERGQIYVPYINFLLLIGGVLLILGFRSSSALASSYGFAVAATMFLTTTAFSFVVLYVWEWSIWKLIAFVFFAIPLDFIYLAATVTKLPAGHYLTLIISMVIIWLLSAWFLGNRALSRRAQRLDIPVADFADMIEMRHDLAHSARPAIFLQHLPFPSEVEVTPNALLRQVQITSMLYQPAVIVEFIDSSFPHIPEEKRLYTAEYPNNIHVVRATFGYWEAASINPVIALGKARGWWKDETDVVYFAVREDLRLASANELSWLVKWPYFFLHKLDQPQPRSLHINAMRYVELGMPIDI
jgi:KUP system potassium uptake protein